MLCLKLRLNCPRSVNSNRQECIILDSFSLQSVLNDNKYYPPSRQTWNKCKTLHNPKMQAFFFSHKSVFFVVLLQQKLCTYFHPAHSFLRKESPAELMLPTFVWDKTGSGTARSKTENGLHSQFWPTLSHVFACWHCLTYNQLCIPMSQCSKLGRDWPGFMLLGWLTSGRWQTQNTSMARLGLELSCTLRGFGSKWDFWAGLG